MTVLLLTLLVFVGPVFLMHRRVRSIPRLAFSGINKTLGTIGWFCEEIHRFNDFLIYLFPVRRLRMLRTMELWAWWSMLRRACPPSAAAWIGPGLTGPSDSGRPAFRLGWRGYASDYLFLDKFNRKHVEHFYNGGYVGGYSREELKALMKGADIDVESDTPPVFRLPVTGPKQIGWIWHYGFICDACLAQYRRGVKLDERSSWDGEKPHACYVEKIANPGNLITCGYCRTELWSKP